MAGRGAYPLESTWLRGLQLGGFTPLDGIDDAAIEWLFGAEDPPDPPAPEAAPPASYSPMSFPGLT